MKLLLFVSAVCANNWENRRYTVEETPYDYIMSHCKMFLGNN
jgi:hypothetical protein